MQTLAGNRDRSSKYILATYVWHMGWVPGFWLQSWHSCCIWELYVWNPVMHWSLTQFLCPIQTVVVHIWNSPAWLSSVQTLLIWRCSLNPRWNFSSAKVKPRVETVYNRWWRRQWGAVIALGSTALQGATVHFSFWNSSQNKRSLKTTEEFILEPAQKSWGPRKDWHVHENVPPPRPLLQVSGEWETRRTPD